MLNWSAALEAGLLVLSPTLYPPRLLFCKAKITKCMGKGLLHPVVASLDVLP